MTLTTNGQTEAAASDGEAAIRLIPIEITTIKVTIIGTTELIMHRWSEKAKQMMREAQTKSKTIKQRRDPKNPQEEYEAAFYRLPDGQAGMPATAFKAAMVDGCRYFEGITMTAAKQMLFVVGESADNLVPIEGTPRMREDTPRLANGICDLRYRPGFFPWRATLAIRFPTNRIDAASVVSLVEAAGMCGVGEWRPTSPKSRTGSFGMWEVER